MIEIIHCKDTHFDLLLSLKLEFLEFRQKSKDGADLLKRVNSAKRLIEMYLTKEDSTYFIAKLNGEIAGYIHITIDSIINDELDVNAYVQDLYVREKYRRKGVGSALLEEGRSKFRENQKVAGITTDSNNLTAINFYTKRGFLIYKRDNCAVYFKETKNAF